MVSVISQALANFWCRSITHHHQIQRWVTLDWMKFHWHALNDMYITVTSHGHHGMLHLPTTLLIIQHLVRPNNNGLHHWPSVKGNHQWVGIPFTNWPKCRKHFSCQDVFVFCKILVSVLVLFGELNCKCQSYIINFMFSWWQVRKLYMIKFIYGTSGSTLVICSYCVYWRQPLGLHLWDYSLKKFRVRIIYERY